MTGDGITLEGVGQATGRFLAAVDDGRTEGDAATGDPPADPAADGQTPPPPPTRDQAQGERRNLIEAIMSGDQAAVDQSLSFFERLAERFGMGDLFNTIKGFIDSLMGGGQPVTDEQAGQVRTMTDGLIDQTLPATDPAPTGMTR